VLIYPKITFTEQLQDGQAKDQLQVQMCPIILT